MQERFTLIVLLIGILTHAPSANCQLSTSPPKEWRKAPASSSPSHGEWHRDTFVLVYSAQFTDEAGHVIEGRFQGPVAWDRDARQRIYLKAWDDSAEFHLLSDKSFQIPNRLIKGRLKSLAPGRIGTLSGNILKVRLTGTVEVKPNVRLRSKAKGEPADVPVESTSSDARLVTNDGQYELLVDVATAKRLDGKMVVVQAELTGNVSIRLLAGMLTPTTPSPSGEEPQIKILSVDHETTAIQYWTNPAAKLMWTVQLNEPGPNWNQAKNYCTTLNFYEWSNWRLPSINELQAIYAYGHEDWYITGFVKDTLGWAWSGSAGGVRDEYWTMYFRNGDRSSRKLSDSENGRALCVRPVGK